ncbi:hypothetical protein F4779DRAFT_183000 [Xylariaceae sp. FL0662B]|nr:hypothetical protein F4779DRAFT_183000 [Xylariaceae sp. FL0662B]
MLVDANFRVLRLAPNRDASQPGLGSGPGPGRDLARRAQVRKAQVRHRQRKANYTKQLEMDIAKLRDLIEQAERESAALRGQNEAFRHRLTTHAASSSAVHHHHPPTAATPVAPSSFTLAVPSVAEVAYSAPPAPDYTVHLQMPGLMNTPVFQVERAPPASGSASSTLDPQPGSGAEAASSAADTSGTGGLTEVQTDQAINFILALEHICWDHFDHSYFAHGSYDPTANEHGHGLMASALALQSAPATVFTQLSDVQTQLRSGTTPQPEISWRQEQSGTTAAAGLSLQSLYGLATALNPPDHELAPVQAWFEIVRLYGAGVALDAPLMDRVRAEFAGVVKCLHFGAVIERDAFESVLRRVIGREYDVDIDIIDDAAAMAGFTEGTVGQ